MALRRVSCVRDAPSALLKPPYPPRPMWLILCANVATGIPPEDEAWARPICWKVCSSVPARILTFHRLGAHAVRHPLVLTCATPNLLPIDVVVLGGTGVAALLSTHTE